MGKTHSPSLIVLLNFASKHGGVNAVRALQDRLRRGDTLEEIAISFGMDVPGLSRKINRMFYRDWFLYDELEEYLDHLSTQGKERIDYERRRKLRLHTPHSLNQAARETTQDTTRA